MQPTRDLTHSKKTKKRRKMAGRIVLLCTKIDRATFDCPLGNPITKQRKPLYYVTYHIQSPNDKTLTFKGPYVGPWYKTGYREGNFFALSMCQTIRVKFKRFSTSLVGMNSFLLSRCYTIKHEFGYWAQSANALNLSPLSAPPLLRVDPQLAHFCWHTEADFDSR